MTKLSRAACTTDVVMLVSLLISKTRPPALEAASGVWDNDTEQTNPNGQEFLTVRLLNSRPE